MTEWTTKSDAWLQAQDGSYVRWSAVETISTVPTAVPGSAPRKYDGWDIVVRLSRGAALVGHYETKAAADEAIKGLLGRLSDYYRHE